MSPGGRVLQIAHHFPPAGGSGANRALAFARYLPAAGWTPTVLTVGVPWAAPFDAELWQEVPPELQVIRTRSFEPRPAPAPQARPARSSAPAPGAAQATPAIPVRAWRAHAGHLKRFPDAHLGWLPFAVGAGRRQAYDVAYSTSGPFTSHLVGLALKRLTGRPWVVELRDGWYRWNRAILPAYPRWRDVLERRLEGAVVEAADRVVLVTERMARAFRAQYARVPAARFVVVSNGFDPRQIPISAPAPAPAPEADAAGCFEVLHGGALYYGRSVGAVLDAFATLDAQDPAFRASARLTLLGTLDPAAQAEVARRGLHAQVRVVPQVGHAAALGAMARASLLLLVANTTPGAEATVPGKLFEYLAMGRPILAVAPPDSATADVLAQTGGGWLAPADDAAAIARGLAEAFQQARAAQAPRPDARQVATFDRRMLAAQLAAQLDAVRG